MEEQEKISTILVVDDLKANLYAFREALSLPRFKIITAQSGQEALSIMLKQKVHLILLDVQMPGMDGFEVALLVKGNKVTENIPIIFITAIHKDIEYVEKGYEVGAVNYVFKPVEPDVLISKIDDCLRYYQYLDKVAEYEQKIKELRRGNKLRGGNVKWEPTKKKS